MLLLFHFIRFIARVILSPFFFCQYNRRAWTADEMAIDAFLRGIGPDDIVP
jgi:hypothetical protein